MLTTMYKILKYPIAVYLLSGVIVWDWNFINWIPEYRLTIGLLIIISTLVGIDKNNKR